jgi:hypothetical protein
MTTGEEMLFPAETRTDQKEKKRLFLNELKIYAKIDPVSASQLQVVTRFDDHRLWIVVKKIAFSPLIAFKKGTDGSVERVTIEDDSDKLRRLTLMKEDGYSLEKIEEMEGKLSDKEREFLKRERR